MTLSHSHHAICATLLLAHVKTIDYTWSQNASSTNQDPRSFMNYWSGGNCQTIDPSRGVILQLDLCPKIDSSLGIASWLPQREPPAASKNSRSFSLSTCGLEIGQNQSKARAPNDWFVKDGDCNQSKDEQIWFDHVFEDWFRTIFWWIGWPNFLKASACSRWRRICVPNRAKTSIRSFRVSFSFLWTIGEPWMFHAEHHVSVEKKHINSLFT